MCNTNHLPRNIGFKYSRGMYMKELLLDTIHGDKIEVPDSQRFIHLQFRRFAGCPICNLHLQNFARRQEEIRNHNIREIIVFHSSKENLLKYAADFPFDIIADPGKSLYSEYGVETSMKAIFNINALASIIRGVANSIQQTVRKRKPLPALRPEGGSFGLPADFLIAPDGRLLGCRYGRHADDQWSVEDLLQVLRQSQTMPGISSLKNKYL